jgi:hypothetical protein
LSGTDDITNQVTDMWSATFVDELSSDNLLLGLLPPPKELTRLQRLRNKLSYRLSRFRKAWGVAWGYDWSDE